jgi:hypothetical protein
MGYENSKEYRLEYRIVLCCFSSQPIAGVDPKRSDPKTLASYYGDVHLPCDTAPCLSL